jgi:FAD:protein FMN transferase
MENEGRRRALKFFVTACVISAMYYFVMENIRPAVEVDGGPREAMGTAARIIAVAKNEKKANNALKTGFDELIRINKLLSEDINRVNQKAFAGPVKVSKELFEVMQTGIDYTKLSGGAFDITITDSNIGGYEKLVLDTNNKTVRFTAERLQLDLSGIAKGFAIDKAVDVMKLQGAIGGLVDAGGVIRCFGRPAHGGNWLIENAPDSVERIADSNKIGMVLKLKDCAAASNLGGVTIIAPKAMIAEVIASAVSVMGPEKGLELVDLLLGVEAIIMSEKGVVKSRGADAYISQ